MNIHDKRSYVMDYLTYVYDFFIPKPLYPKTFYGICTRCEHVFV